MPKIDKQIIVANKKGLHARPAALFVQLVSKYNIEVTISCNGQQVNGKSIMGLLTLGAQAGVVLDVSVDGDDASAAMTDLEKFLSKQEEDLIK